MQLITSVATILTLLLAIFVATESRIVYGRRNIRGLRSSSNEHIMRALKSSKAPKSTKSPKNTKAPKSEIVSSKAPTTKSTKAPKNEHVMRALKSSKAPKSTKSPKNTKASKSSKAPKV